MATGLIGDTAGSRPRAPGQPRRTRAAGRPGLAQRPGKPAEPELLRPGARPGPARRPGPAQRPGEPAEPELLRPGARPGPARRPGPGQRPAARPGPVGGRTAGTAAPAPDQATGTRAAARPQARPRAPFVLLLLGLLGGGLICLLLINTTLAQGSFQIQAMQQKNTALTQQVQALQQQTTQQESPASIAARARQLGMQPAGRLRFIDLKSGRIYSEPARVPDVPYAVPGYTP